MAAKAHVTRVEQVITGFDWPDNTKIIRRPAAYCSCGSLIGPCRMTIAEAERDAADHKKKMKTSGTTKRPSTQVRVEGRLA